MGDYKVDLYDSFLNYLQENLNIFKEKLKDSSYIVAESYKVGEAADVLFHKPSYFTWDFVINEISWNVYKHKNKKSFALENKLIEVLDTNKEIIVKIKKQNISKLLYNIWKESLEEPIKRRRKMQLYFGALIDTQNNIILRIGDINKKENEILEIHIY